MENLNFVQSVSERDIDFIVLEELQVSAEFRDWFSSRVYEYPTYKNEIGTWHSVCDSELGQSDLIFIFESVDGARKAILIENKIDAPPQPSQGDRYLKRGEKGLMEGYWDEFKSCVIAPKRYLDSSKHAEMYDVEIAYEEIMSYFVARRSADVRYDYRAKIIQEGIEQNRRGYQPKFSDEMTTFIMDYWDYIKDRNPNLGMREAKPRPAGSTWVTFHPPNFPKHISLAHQLTAGYVKLFFHGKTQEFQEILDRYENSGLEGLKIQQAGKSVALSIAVSKINPLVASFDESKEAVTKAVDVVERLIQLANEKECI